MLFGLIAFCFSPYKLKYCAWTCYELQETFFEISFRVALKLQPFSQSLELPINFIATLNWLSRQARHTYTFPEIACFSQDLHFKILKFKCCLKKCSTVSIFMTKCVNRKYVRRYTEFLTLKVLFSKEISFSQ